jgi:HSP20 family molecular chaperone IbpA
MGHLTKPKSPGIVYALAGTAPAEVSWRPRADVSKTAHGWMIKFEIAGVPPEDLNVYALGRRLTVSGIRRDSIAEHGCNHYMMEITYNRFERTVELPCEITAEDMEIRLLHGILHVHIASNTSGGDQ